MLYSYKLCVSAIFLSALKSVTFCEEKQAIKERCSRRERGLIIKKYGPQDGSTYSAAIIIFLVAVTKTRSSHNSQRLNSSKLGRL
jgi:hypothetical protein